MRFSTRCLWLYALATLAVATPGFRNMADAQLLQEEASFTDDIEHLTRGPLHEAFAEPTHQDPAPGITAPRIPPERVDEVPPEVKPAGDDVQWIPGYWHWDDERLDFVWVSGVWRKHPPGRVWVPGHWEEVDGRYQWVSGVWVASDSDPGGFLPYPPESLEAGPSSIASADDHFWVPGCWLYRTGSYSWRPGFWTMTHGNWVWIPSYYIWTPRGCMYVDGYWDHPFSQRGVLFCPVYFHAYGSQRRVHYSPHVTLNSSGIFFHLFVRSGCNHYYFGDYYGSRHGEHAYYPWFDFHRVGRRYDPFHAHFEAKHRHGGTDYTGRYRGWHQYFADGADHRPPRTFAAQHGFEVRHKNSPHIANTVLARNLKELTADVNSRQRFVHRSEQDRRNLTRHVEQVQQLGAQRTKLEAQLHPKPAVAVPHKSRGKTVSQVGSEPSFKDKLLDRATSRAKFSEQARQPLFRLHSKASKDDAIDRSNAARLRAKSSDLTQRPVSSAGDARESLFARTKPTFARSSPNHARSAATGRPNPIHRNSSGVKPADRPPGHPARAMPPRDFRQSRIAPVTKPSTRPASIAGKGQASVRARSITSGRSNTARSMHSRSRSSARAGRGRADDK